MSNDEVNRDSERSVNLQHAGEKISISRTNVYKLRSEKQIKAWRRAAAPEAKVRWIGFSLFCIEFGFHFKAPFRVMIALAKNLSTQKKDRDRF